MHRIQGNVYIFISGGFEYYSTVPIFYAYIIEKPIFNTTQISSTYILSKGEFWGFTCLYISGPPRWCAIYVYR